MPITSPLKTITDPLKEIKMVKTDPKKVSSQIFFLHVPLGTIAQLFTTKKIPTSQSLKKKYILIILVDFYASLSRFFLLPGSGSTFPEVDPDPVRLYGSESETLITNIGTYYFKLGYFPRLRINLIQ